jgi:hypothetical protein
MGGNIPRGLEKIQEALDRGADRRPPLYTWMLRHHDELAAMFGGRRLDWAILTEAFAELGFCGPDGGPLKPKSVQQAWYRVGKQRGSSSFRRGPRVTTAPVIQELAKPLPSLAARYPVASSAPAAPETEEAAEQSKTPSALADIYAEMNKRSGRG